MVSSRREADLESRSESAESRWERQCCRTSGSGEEGRGGG